MKLWLRPLAPSPHTDLVGALGWNSSNELFSCSHDFSIWRWSRNGEAVNKVYACTESIGAMHWYPATPQRNFGVSNGDMFAIGCSNGAFSIISKGGREERRIEAHKGAILSLKWNMEGNTLATGGADGFVKLWSRNGMLRSNVFQSEHSVTALSWGPDSTQLLFSSGKSLTIKQVQSSGKHNSWEGHDGPVVGLDWNRVTKLIVSIGQECCYKVWDWFGRLLFKSESCQYSFASVSWCPSGDFFVLGAQKSIVLCDKRGQILSKENMKNGSVKASTWSIDGSQIALGCTDGKIMFGQVIYITMEWLRSKAVLEDPYHIQIQDFLGERVKSLQFQDSVVNMSLGFDHLVVTTISQCFVYHIKDWRTPYVINVKDICMILAQCDHSFLIADSANELHIFTYDGKKLSNPYFNGLRKESLNNRSIGLSKDTLAVIDCTDSRALKLLDTNTGKELEQVLQHPVSIVEVDLNQHGTRSERILIFIDLHNDFFITSILKPCITKLSSLTTKALWSSEAHIIAGMVDQDLVIWYYPQAVFVDEDLLTILQMKKESFKGKKCSIAPFSCNPLYYPI